MSRTPLPAIARALGSPSVLTTVADSAAFSVAGGGDTVAALNQAGVAGDFERDADGAVLDDPQHGWGRVVSDAVDGGVLAVCPVHVPGGVLLWAFVGEL